MIKDSDGSIAGCHDTKVKAQKQLAALYANEKGTQMPKREVDNSAWDGNRAMSACETASDYRSICAGEKTIGESDERQHWALPHHYLGKGPNAAGTRNALSRLPQTQNLKSESAARSHLEGHMSEINPDRIDHPRDDLIRMVPMPIARADVGDGNTLVGFASTFNDWTVIDSWEGRFRERIDPAAFDKTLKESRDRVKVLFNHGFDPQIGDKPLGKPSVIEPRSAGLWTETPLDDTSYNADLKALLRSGALDGMSFRFSVTREEWGEGEDGMEERTIKELKLFEFGPVTFPAYEATSAGIRNAGAFQVWRNGANAVPPSSPDRSTPDQGAAASEEDRRNTSVLDEKRKRLEELEQALSEEAEEIERWARPTS